MKKNISIIILILLMARIGQCENLELCGLDGAKIVDAQDSAMAFSLPALPYPFNALEPHIDACTMEIHHGKHHAAYVAGLNAALEKVPELKGKSLEEVFAGIGSVSDESVRTALRNHGGGHWNHTLFWNTLASAEKSGAPSPELLKAIETSFGSMDDFKKAYIETATKRFGSSWAWLISSNGKLRITSTANQDNPLMNGIVPDADLGTPLLGIDVWEHAYYLHYQNRRADYINAWWSVINWAEVSRRFAVECQVVSNTHITSNENTNVHVISSSDPSGAESNELSQPIKFAGVWLRGNANDAKKMFPVGSQFAVFPGASDSGALYSRELLKGIRTRQRSGGKRIIDMIAPDDFLPNAASGRALVMACAINYEYFEKTIEVGVAKLYVEVGFDLLICNFSDRSIVMSLPGICQYIDKATANPEQRAAEILSDKIYKKSLVEEFFKQADRVWSGELAFTTVGLNTLEIRDEAKQRFPDLFGKNPELFYSQLISNRFSREIGLPIIPWSNGEEAVYYGLRENLVDASTLEAKRIAEQSENGASFLLKRPEYMVDLIIPGFIDKKVQQTDLGYTSAHYALARLKITRGADSEPFYNEVIQGGATRINANSHKLTPIWITSWDASALMFNDAAKAIKSSSNESIKEMIRTSVVK